MEPMSMSVYGDDLFVEVGDNQGTHLINFSRALRVEIGSMKDYMCKANAEEFLSVIENLEREARQLRLLYTHWELNGFKKEDV